MTTSRLRLKDIVKMESSRRSAIAAREEIFTLLQKFDTIEIDIKDLNFTPSVADEIIGELALSLGADSFKRKIKILNASESQMALMKHVIARRLANQSEEN